MKLSADNKGRIYDEVHRFINELRYDLRENYLATNPMRDKVDFKLSQVEVPIAQAIIKLLEENKRKP